MIVNIPTKTDYENLSKENLVQAFMLLYKAFNDYTQIEDGVLLSEVSEEDVWTYNKGVMRTSIILLHQAIEGLMKGHICDVSPLLLIDKPRKDWPVMPGSDDKDFDSLYTISGEILVTTFCAVQLGINIDIHLHNFIDDIRRKRNKVVHGVSDNFLSAKYILQSILRTFTIWFGKDEWYKALKQNIFKDPLFGYYDEGFESAIISNFLDFTLRILGKNTMSNYCNINLRNRAYYCPSCKYHLEKDYDNYVSKWAFLLPNSPESQTLFCYNCEESFEVKRTKCQIDDCKGNVLSNEIDSIGENICLTCGFENNFIK